MYQFINTIVTGLLIIFNAGIVTRMVFAIMKSMSDEDINLKKVLKKYFIVLVIGNLIVSFVKIFRNFYEL